MISNGTYISCHHCGLTHPVYHVTPPGWEIREVVGINDGGGFTTLTGFVCGDCIKRQAAEPMSDDTPRERTGVMEHGCYLDDRGQIARAIDNQGFDWGWDDDAMLEAADDVIAYLWRRADDDDVVEAVADELNFYLLPEDGTSENATQAAINTLLTALLGPRTNGGNYETD